MSESEYPRILDPSVQSDDSQKLYDRLMYTVIGQERAVRQFVKVYQQIQVGLNKPDRPAGVFLFMGPTGVGKTELVRSTAGFLLGKKEAITRIDCGEFQHSHEVSKLIGSPPGYVGYDEKKTGSARLSQKNIDRYQTPKNKINFVLFDEIEEANDALFSAILQILDAGRLTLGNGEEVDFSHSVIIMTSNLGEKETQAALMGKGLGLRPDKVEAPKEMVENVYGISKKVVERRFKSKFINRLDRIIVFRSLEQDSLLKILNIELKNLQFRVWSAPSKKWSEAGSKGAFPQFQVVFRATEAAKKKLLAEGTSAIYGARELNRAIDRFVTFPIGSLMGSKQIEHGDVVEIDYKEGSEVLTFSVVDHRDIKPLPPLRYDGTPPPTLTPGPGSKGKAFTPQYLLPEKSKDTVENDCPHGTRREDCLICSQPPSAFPGWHRRPMKW